ncbi:MAG: glycosyltransferase family 2 protein [Patescibacteria group bacterium]|nr:glycosyltransferase family 2 protein [Patescibacteria group bacterium]MDD5164073.1 glycosyltransferase family 2 protein [Patescibacteria group bacterium]MDD5534843.1 glycosyltransferase family 2 protein [Patescibacteria group bacterium]
MEKNFNKIVIVIPAYNEIKTIKEVIKDAQTITKEIIVIDDASSDKTGEAAKNSGAKVFRHILNLGLGGALKTGFDAALRENADIVVTMDADGQHKAKEIPNLIKPILEDKADAVIGSRFLNYQEMPKSRRMCNLAANWITFIICGVKTTDSQSGLRAFNRVALEKIEIKSRHMEVSSEFFKEIKNKKLRFAEVPTESIYTEYSLSKGQNFFLGIKTLFKLIIDRFI